MFTNYQRHMASLTHLFGETMFVFNNLCSFVVNLF